MRQLAINEDVYRKALVPLVPSLTDFRILYLLCCCDSAQTDWFWVLIDSFIVSDSSPYYPYYVKLLSYS